MRKRNIPILLLVSFLVVSCSLLKSISKQDSEKINLPDNVEVRNPESINFEDERIVVMELPAENEFYLGKDKIEREALRSEFEKLQKTDALRAYRGWNNLYIKATSDISYGNIVDVLKSFPPKPDIYFNLIVRVKRKEFLPDGKEKLNALTVWNSCKNFSVSPSLEKPIKPNPLTLVLTMKKDGTFNLNNEEVTLDSLAKKLEEIFKQREINFVVRPGTNEVEKTVFVKAPRSAKYDNVVRLIESVYLSGGFPICLQTEDLEP